MISTNTSGELPNADPRCNLKNYQRPRLSLLGDICSLTETGSAVGMEDSLQNNMCVSFPPFFNVNMTFNMC